MRSLNLTSVLMMDYLCLDMTLIHSFPCNFSLLTNMLQDQHITLQTICQTVRVNMQYKSGTNTFH